MLKRFMAFLIIIAMMTSLAVFANPLGFPESRVEETSEWVTADQMAILNKLGVTNWGSVADMNGRQNEIVSRWIVCYFINKIVKLDLTAPQKFETLFDDLTSEHKYYSTIKGAVKAGYMNGYPDGTFRSDNPISTQEAATVCLRLLGYGPYMEIVGRERALQKTCLLEGIPVGEKMTMTQLHRMFWNMLNSPAVKSGAISVSDRETMSEFQIDEEYLGFEHFFGVFYKTAVLDGVKGTTLNDSTDNLKDGYVTIADVQYKYGDDVTELLGYKVDFVFREKDGEIGEILHIAKSLKNKELVLTHKDIVEYKDGKYVYEVNDKDKEVEIDSQTKVIYNDVANPLYDDSEMIPDFGTVTLIDYDGKKGYEVVKIADYDFYYVSNVDGEKSRIYDNEGETPKILDLKDCDMLEIRDGEKFITVDRVKKGTLLVVRRSSKNCDYDKAVAETFKVSQKNIHIRKVTEDSVWSEDTEFEVWNNIGAELNLGKAYDLFIFEGEVVYAAEDLTQGADVSYLLALAEDDVPLTSEVKVAVMDMNGTFGEYKTTEKLTIDGVTYTNCDAMRTRLLETARLSNGYLEEHPIAQPVKIEFNGNGCVKSIDTLGYNEGAEEEESLQKFGSNTENVRYDGYGYGFYVPESEGSTAYNVHVCSIATTTQNLAVPNERFDEDLYSSQKFEDSSNYRVDVLEWDKDSLVAETVFVYYSGRSSIDVTTNASIVSDVRKEMNEEGDTICLVECWTLATQAVYECDEAIFAQLSIGDVCQFAVNKKNEIVSMQKIYDIDDDFPARGERVTSTANNYAKARRRGTFFGSLVTVDGEFIRVTEALPDDIEGYDVSYNADNFRVGNAAIFKYTETRGEAKVEKTNLSSATPYTTDNENPSLIILNIMIGLRQIYIIEK